MARQDTTNRIEDVDFMDEEEDEFTEEQILNAMKNTTQKHDKFKFLSCLQRNVLLIGRTKTGKSTIADVIRDVRHVGVHPELYSQTRKLEFHHIATTISHDNMIYNINIIDTPGFYDRITADAAASGEIALSNEQIKGYIDTCMIKDITQINIFAFVFSIKHSIHPEDVKSMKFVKDNYPHLSEHFALILTHCEEYNEQQRNKLIDNFFAIKDVHDLNLRQYFGLGIHFMGCIRPESYEQRSMKGVRREMRNVLLMRQKFLDFIIQREDKYKIHYDAVYTDATRNVNEAVLTTGGNENNNENNANDRDGTETIPPRPRPTPGVCPIL